TWSPPSSGSWRCDAGSPTTPILPAHRPPVWRQRRQWRWRPPSPRPRTGGRPEALRWRDRRGSVPGCRAPYDAAMPHPDGNDRAPQGARLAVTRPGTRSGTRPPSMADVARIAGVSHQTVSRVLNDFPSIRPETRQRVLEAITLLGYRRNTAARTLATNRSGSIGVITADMSHYGPASTMLGIESASRAAGYNLTL